MSAKPVLVIPARYGSSRLPGKPLRLLGAGDAAKPMIQHVYERAQQVVTQGGFGQMLVATDDARIQDVCVGMGATVCMTSTDHETGSDRLAEVAQQQGWDDDQVVVNLQGDEPLTPLANLMQLAENLQTNPDAQMATLATPLVDADELRDPNIVKVVRDLRGMALYFSRAAIPHQRDGEEVATGDYALRHIGMYAYRAGFLKAFAALEPCALENLEKLEQLRAMCHGFPIHVDIAAEVPGPGVDTEADLQRVSALL